MTGRKSLGQPVPRREFDEAPLDRIFVRDFVLDCAIGAYDEEKGVTQKVGFTVEASVRRGAGRLDDDLANVPSYDDIMKIVRAAASGDHINLVETLAEQIAERCLDDERIVSALVRVEKLERGPKAVGVEIVRRRASTA